jgi:hypothetical protein
MELVIDLDREIVIVGERRRRTGALQKVAAATHSRGPRPCTCVVCYSFSKKCATFLPASSV